MSTASISKAEFVMYINSKHVLNPVKDRISNSFSGQDSADEIGGFFYWKFCKYSDVYEIQGHGWCE